MPTLLDDLAATLVLGSLLDLLSKRCGEFDLVDHHVQGEFHHDVILRVADSKGALPGQFLVVSTNCNGGVKDVLCFDEAPAPSALWKWRCPDVEEFEGALPTLLASARTMHWFDPCELLVADARSEIRPEFRRRQRGGGWELDEEATARGPCGTRDASRKD